MSIKNLFPFFIVAFLLTSCMFTEELYVNKNGSGNYAFKIDMGKMMKSMSDMGPKDSLKEPQKIDTIIYMSNILKEYKDSIKNLDEKDRKTLYALKNFNMKMHIDEANNEMLMTITKDFKNLSELTNMEEKINKIQSISDKKSNNKTTETKASVYYSLNDKTFKRKVLLKDLSKKALKKIDSINQQSSAFLEGSIYKIIYHFEDKIKNVTFKDADISNDKKTITIEVPMDSLMKNPQLLDFEVKLK